MREDLDFTRIQAAQEAQEALNNAIPDGLDQYVGQMVILRAGMLFATGENAQNLIESDQLEPDDLVYLVPPPGPYLFVAQDAAESVFRPRFL